MRRAVYLIYCGALPSSLTVAWLIKGDLGAPEWKRILAAAAIALSGFAATWFAGRSLSKTSQQHVAGKTKQTPSPPYHLNAPGDFYVEDQFCLSCEAPEHEAPDLMAHDSSSCYFKRQPQTPEETERAIQAVMRGCCGAVRYGGHDPQIITRLVELGSKDDCDNA